jgi:predicted HTH transcriptional regulator
MTQEELKKLISKDETKNVELKKSTGELREGMHTACAFLNSDGGVLVFGVTPSLNIVGQIVSESTRRDIAQALAGIEPAVSPVIEYVDIPGKPNLQVIVLRFNPWVYGQKPYTFHGKPYYRLESVTKAMPRDMYDERLRQNFPHQFSWEMRVADKITIGDLDEKKIRGLVRLGVEERRISEESLSEPIEVVLEKWGSGVKRIIDVCKEEGSPEPFWTEEAGYTVVSFPLARLNGRNVTQNVTQNVAQKDDDVPRRQKVEQVISANSIISTDALATMFGVTKRTILRDLKDLGYVWEGAAKNGHWKTRNVAQNVTQNVTQDIEDGPRVQKVEQIILVDSMKTKEYLAKMFGVSTRTILRDLKKLGYAWEGASKNGHWVREKGRFVDANKTSVNKIEKEMKRIGK